MRIAAACALAALLACRAEVAVDAKTAPAEGAETVFDALELDLPLPASEPAPELIDPDAAPDADPELLRARREAAPPPSDAALPCGDPLRLVAYKIRWRPPEGDAAGGPISEYALLRTPIGEPLIPEERVRIQTWASEPDPPRVAPILSADVSGFRPERGWSVALLAVGPGGDSPRSNELTIPQQISGPCPPPPPPPPVLIDIVAQLRALIDQARAAGADTTALQAAVDALAPKPPAAQAP